MSSLPSEFRARFAVHNRNCWVAAFLSLLGAWLGWLFFFALFTAGVLLAETIRTNNTDLFKPPPWYVPAGLGLAGFLLVWAAIDRWRRRYRPPSDRSIIGWHLIPEVLMLPARMTFAIWEQIGGHIRLSVREKEECWRLLQVVFAMKRAEATQITQEFADPRELSKLLTALQLTGWIDLHRGDEDWFYRVISDQEVIVRAMTQEMAGEVV